MDVQDFMDEGEISVKFMNPREMVVEGHVKHNATNSKAEKKFVHHFVLAGDVDVDGASSIMSADGVLTITAPKKVKFCMNELYIRHYHQGMEININNQADVG